ncbi:3-oxoacyl-ACP reductase family protein [Kutzneria chonburiensis]|uniref:3-oxoacyl-ACP reductase family protein n=1 Tax=Kutzneria chonburiensis TaxID=1483604 RepID=A0ABV6MS93_9PSEU|nr:3-oxoacyl-ACP reductase family protein [Kutzneria chonburiensis]
MTVLAGRKALVTGAARGIGAAIVRRLVRDGAAVAFTYSASVDDAEKLVAEVAETGGIAVAIRADSGDPEQVRRSIDETVAQLGGLDILVNNAGILPAAPIESLSMAQFDRVVAVNVRSVFAAVQAALPHLGTGGRIINVGSINADRVPLAGMSIYAMSKAAVAGMTRALARELGPHSITVNNLQVGPTATDMTPEDGEIADALRELMALGRFGRPEEIAGAVSYLAGPDAAFVTGANWNVDGGFTV